MSAPDRSEVENAIAEALPFLDSHSGQVDTADLTKVDLDSLQLVELALVVQDTWNIDLRPIELDQVRTVADVVDLIVSRLS